MKTYKQALTVFCSLVIVMQLHDVFGKDYLMRQLREVSDTYYALAMLATPICTIVVMLFIIFYFRRLDISLPDKKVDALDDY